MSAHYQRLSNHTGHDITVLFFMLSEASDSGASVLVAPMDLGEEEPEGNIYLFLMPPPPISIFFKKGP